MQLMDIEFNSYSAPSVAKAIKVSIGMPVYNGEPFIHEALTSLLAQSFTDFELIIYDNASTDGTETICREFAAKDARVRYLRHEHNLGAYDNFLMVFDEAVGKYFMWAAADDIWAPDWIELLLPVSEKYNCLAYGTVISIDEKGSAIFNPSSGNSFDFSGAKLLRRTRFFFAKSAHGKANPIYGLLPRAILENAHFKILKEVSLGSDMVFLFDLLRFIEIRRPKESTFLYKRIHAGSAANQNAPGGMDKNIVYKVICIIGSSITEPFKELTIYRKYSNSFEKILFPTVTIIMLLRNLFFTFKLIVKRIFKTN
jgi:glycosyltransferase involved in cell wall biosynthesis